MKLISFNDYQIGVLTSDNSVIEITDLLPDLPDESQEYYIFKWDVSDAPIMWVGVGLEGTKEEQYQFNKHS